MHFGISDKLKSKNIMVANEILLRSFTISLPLILHNEQTLKIFYFLNISEDYGIFLTEIFQYLVSNNSSINFIQLKFNNEKRIWSFH